MGRMSRESIRAGSRKSAPHPSRMSAAEYIAQSKPKRSKYGNIVTAAADGSRVDSRKEARRLAQLEQRQRDGEISQLKRQVPFILAPSVRLEGEKRAKPALRLIADFTYWENCKLVVEDTKSAPTAKTAVFRIKRHLLKAVHGLDVRIVK